MTSCSRCGKPLSKPESVARGMGPTCASKSGIHISSTRKTRGKTGEAKILDVAKKVAVGSIVGGISPFVPAIIPIYKTYNIFMMGKRIYDAYCKIENKNKSFDKILSESTKFGTSEVSKKLSEDKASEAAKEIRYSAESTGIISEIAKKTKIDENIYGSMFEGSLKMGILSGIGNFTSYIIEDFVGG